LRDEVQARQQFDVLRVEPSAVHIQQVSIGCDFTAFMALHPT
jgi:hypothetical protein